MAEHICRAFGGVLGLSEGCLYICSQQPWEARRSRLQRWEVETQKGEPPRLGSVYSSVSRKDVLSLYSNSGVWEEQLPHKRESRVKTSTPVNKNSGRWRKAKALPLGGGHPPTTEIICKDRSDSTLRSCCGPGLGSVS